MLIEQLFNGWFRGLVPWDNLDPKPSRVTASSRQTTSKLMNFPYLYNYKN